MKNLQLFLICTFLLISTLTNAQQKINNPYTMLPLGDIKPEGWLKEQLIRQKNGMTGNLDAQYPKVVGANSAWLGGDGDTWERGPYWLDGLLPLAYLLDDKELKAKSQKWIEWLIANQREDGYIGPKVHITPPVQESGVQKDAEEDWWPRMVMLKVCQQYYSATKDPRILKMMTNYFRYQLKQLPVNHLDKWSHWANRRGGDNLQSVIWLYEITGDAFLLELAEILYDQTWPFAKIFQNTYQKQEGIEHLFPFSQGILYPFDQKQIDKMHIGQIQSFHCVNLAQGIKTPVIYYQLHKDPVYINCVKKAFLDLDAFHGQAQGMYGGDEPLHGNMPTTGIEFCSIVEMMYSLESMLTITGDVEMADRLEKIAYNALPTQATDDFQHRQYFQSANQVECSRHRRNFCEDYYHGGTDLCFGKFVGYTCCTANMHQGWPKLIQNLWYKSEDGGLAALVYGPASLKTTVNGRKVEIFEEGSYPFYGEVKFTIKSNEAGSFPIHFRIPKWATGAKIIYNGDTLKMDAPAGTIVKVNKPWKKGDVLKLDLPMNIRPTYWAESSVAIERGPLVYSLLINEDRKWVEGTDGWGSYWEVYPKSDWNYGLLLNSALKPQESFDVEGQKVPYNYPWNLENAPVKIYTKAKKIPDWKLNNHMPVPLPQSYGQFPRTEEEQITLVPYGCTTLRITQFPMVR